MGVAKQLFLEKMLYEEASYEEAQSRLRMSMLCKNCVRPLRYPLYPRIVELACQLDAAVVEEAARAMRSSVAYRRM